MFFFYRYLPARLRACGAAGELGLPPCVREDLVVQLSAVERLVYDQARRDFLDACQALRVPAGGGAAAAAATRGRALGRALSAFTSLRQSTCHPHIVRRRADARAPRERLSFRQIMARLVAEAYAAWDAAARRLVGARLLQAAVECPRGRDPVAALAPVLASARANRAASGVVDLGQAAREVRSMHAGVDEARLPVEEEPPAAAPAPELDEAAARAAAKGKGPAAEAVGATRPREGRGEGAGAAEAASPEGDAAAREARGRQRQWRKVELSALELAAHMLREASGVRVGGGAFLALPPPPLPLKPAKRAVAALEGGGGGGGASGSAGATVPSPRPLPSRPELESLLAAVQAEADAARAALDLDPGAGGGEGWGIRRSRRQAGIEAGDEEAELDLDLEEVAEQVENACIVVREYKELLRRRDPARSAATAAAAAEKEAAAAWHDFTHKLNKQAAVAAADKGKGAAANDDGSGGAGPSAQHNEQEDLMSCPICLDELTDRTITPCSHHFCPACIREALPRGSGPCPICRAPVTEASLLDAVSEEEAALRRAAAEAAAAGGGDFGGKVQALLGKLGALRAADPGAKAVVFSSWGRLLRLAGEALDAHGVGHATLGGATVAQREAALRRFMHDPDCAVLTVVMSTAGGAAGLTLTAAATAFILEPGLNPGLEAQAAARISRLGQDRPTRVVRLLAEGTVDAHVAELQRRKAEGGGGGGGGGGEGAAADVDPGMLITLADQLRSGAGVEEVRGSPSRRQR
jgi:E3 ubiquitin-protein ligase SHPRH